MFAKPTIQSGGVIPKLLPPTGDTTNAFVWKLSIRFPNAPLNRDHGGLFPDTHLHLINKNRRSLVNVEKGSRDSFRSTLMKTLGKRVATLGLES